MEPTIDQALQQGVAAHQEGRLQDAERLYRAILQSQPQHPDANHNLGVIAVSINKADAALPLLKTALEANPKIEQFWVSYIDALITIQKFDDARQVLADAQQAGVTVTKLQIFEEQLQSKLVPSINTPQQEFYDQSRGHQDKFGLIFMGFEFPDKRITKDFKAAYPQVGSIYDLGKWDEYEMLSPKLFAGMYQFWLQKL
jgi:thioredoxin-like negative regulator of GroEL